MIGRRSQPHTSLLIVRNEDGTPKQVRVTGKSARHEARLVRDAIQRHGDRVVSVHDSSGTPLYSQGAWPEAPAGDRVGRAAEEPRHQPDPAPPAVSRTMDRQTEPTQPAYGKSCVKRQGVADVDAFAAGDRYGNVATVDPIANAEANTGMISGDNGEGTAWDLRLPDGSTVLATAKHVVNGDTVNPPIAVTPDSDFAVVAGQQGGGGGLELASRDAQPGEQVAIVTAQQGTIPATVTGTEVVRPEGGGGESFNTTTVDRPVIPGDSGSGAVLIKPGDPDHGKVVGTVSCTDNKETGLVPPSAMREVIGGPSATPLPLETETSRPVAMKSTAAPQDTATRDAFATGHGYETIATPGRLEDSSVQVRGFMGGGSGAVIGDGMVLTADHVAKVPGAPPTIADDPTRDVAVVKQNTGGAPSLQLATQAPTVGQEVTILSDRVGGAQTAHVVQTGEQVHLDVPVPDGTSGATVADTQGRIVSIITHGDDEGGTCRGPSAPAIREAIAVPEPERTAGQPQPGTQIPTEPECIGCSPGISR